MLDHQTSELWKIGGIRLLDNGRGGVLDRGVWKGEKELAVRVVITNHEHVLFVSLEPPKINVVKLREVIDHRLLNMRA